MNPTREWYSAKELAGLVGMPGTERRVRSKGDREGWSHRDVPAACRGGHRRKYHLKSLPIETREALYESGVRSPESAAPSPESGVPAVLQPRGGPLQAQQLIHTAEPTAPASSTSHLKHWQRECMDARLAILREVERRAPALGVTRAVAELVAAARAGDLPEPLQQLVSVANARPGEGRSLTRGTVFLWRNAWAQCGLAALAPRDTDRPEIPDWAPLVLSYYQRPQRPSVRQALEWIARDLGGQGAEIVSPSEHQVRRFLRKMSAIDRERGRLGRAEMGRITWYHDRDTGAFEPFDIGLCDGHSAKFRARSWTGNAAFHPELCAVLDAVTRYVPGWSIGLAESAWTVGEALIHAATVSPEKPIGGIFATLYTDLGSGNQARQNAAEVIGLFARLGTTLETGRAGNPRGRGRIERLQASLWIRAAKELASYTGKDVNRDHAKKIYRITQADLKQHGQSAGLLAKEDLFAWAAAAVEAYNQRPHSALPMIRSTATSPRRHLSPADAVAGWLDRGWRPVCPGPAELAELPRPMERVLIRNGMFSLFGNRYGDPCLAHYHGYQLFATYDVHDGRTARVYDDEHRFLCQARFEANKQSFFPEAKIEKDRAARAARRLAVKQSQIEEILAERDGLLPKPIDITPEQRATAEQMLADAAERERLRAEEEVSRLVALPVPEEPVFWATPAERCEWLHRERKRRELTPEERQEIEDHRHYALTGERIAR